MSLFSFSRFLPVSCCIFFRVRYCWNWPVHRAKCMHIFCHYEKASCLQRMTNTLPTKRKYFQHFCSWQQYFHHSRRSITWLIFRNLIRFNLFSYLRVFLFYINKKLLIYVFLLWIKYSLESCITNRVEPWDWTVLIFSTNEVRTVRTKFPSCIQLSSSLLHNFITTVCFDFSIISFVFVFYIFCTQSIITMNEQWTSFL